MSLKIPSDLQAEAFLLARMLISSQSATDAIGSLRSEDFADPVHRVIFSAMRLLYEQDCEIEPVSVANQMTKHFKDNCDINYLFGLSMHHFGDSDEVKVFIKSIKEQSRLKSMIYVGTEMAAIAASGSKTSEEIQNEALKKIETVFSEDYEKSCRSFGELLRSEYADSGMDYFQYVEEQMENHRKGVKVLRGLPTGYSRLDDILSGFCKGHYIIVGARPGAGKTTLCLNFIHALAKKNIPVGFFSLEMTAVEAMRKLIGIESRLDLEKFDRGVCSHEDYQSLTYHGKNMYNLPIHIDDQESLKVSHLIARAKRMVAANKIEILFIDYLGEVRGDGKFLTKQDEIQGVSKALRAMAKKLKIPVVCIAQLNRDNEKENRAPRKSDLRDSGQIEADAHSILLLHKPSTDDKFQSPGLVKVYIVKNRFGKEGCVHLNFIGEEGKFYEMDYSIKEPVEQDDE